MRKMIKWITKHSKEIFLGIILIIVIFHFLLVPLSATIVERINWGIYFPLYSDQKVIFSEGFGDYEDFIIYQFSKSAVARIIKYNNMIEINEDTVQDVKKGLKEIYDELPSKKQKQLVEEHFTKNIRDFDYYLFVEKPKSYPYKSMLILLLNSKNGELYYFGVTE